MLSGVEKHKGLLKHIEDRDKIPNENNYSQMKQSKVTDRDLSKTHISNIPDVKYKATIISILTGLQTRMEDFRDTHTIEIK